MFLYFDFFINDTEPTENYTYCHPLSLHDALPICRQGRHAEVSHSRAASNRRRPRPTGWWERFPQGHTRSCSSSRAGSSHAARTVRENCAGVPVTRSEEHTSELQSLMRISYAVFCLKKKIYTRHTIKLCASQ